MILDRIDIWFDCIDISFDPIDILFYCIDIIYILFDCVCIFFLILNCNLIITRLFITHIQLKHGWGFAHLSCVQNPDYNAILF